MKMTIKKDKLIEVVSSNRDAHVGIFREAVEGYKKLAVERLEEHIERIKSGSLERVYVTLPAPENHLGDYDRVLKMLELTEDTSMVLDEQEAAQYVMDDWGWKDQFLSSNSSYSMTAARLSK